MDKIFSKAIGAALLKISSPLMKEIGNLLGNKMREFQLNNLRNIIKKAEGELMLKDGKLVINEDYINKNINYKFIYKFIEEASFIEDNTLQNMWGCLLEAHIKNTNNKEDDSMYLSLLSRLTPLQARILNYIGQNTEVYYSQNVLIQANSFQKTYKEISEILKLNDNEISLLDAHLDSMRSMEIIQGGIITDESYQYRRAVSKNKTIAGEILIDLTPAPLGLYLYTKTQGKNNPQEIWRNV